MCLMLNLTHSFSGRSCSSSMGARACNLLSRKQECKYAFTVYSRWLTWPTTQRLFWPTRIKNYHLRQRRGNPPAYAILGLWQCIPDGWRRIPLPSHQQRCSDAIRLYARCRNNKGHNHAARNPVVGTYWYLLFCIFSWRPLTFATDIASRRISVMVRPSST